MADVKRQLLPRCPAREPVAVIGLEEFNHLPPDRAAGLLGSCCPARRWIEAVRAGRPYPGIDALLAGSDAAVAALGEADLRQALDGHPRIGDRPAEGSASSREQAGVTGADAGLRRALAEGNARYEARFGHIYLVCATGRSAGELLGLLRERLGNDEEAEWRVVAAELAKINQIRLRGLIGTGP